MANDVQTVLADYRDSKKKLEALAAAARKQMQARYLALLIEASELQTEFKQSFGVNPDLPAGVKTFSIGSQPKAPTPAESNGKKIGGLKRSLAAAIKNGATVRAMEITKQLAALGVDLSPTAPAPADTNAAPGAIEEFGL